MSAKIIDGRVVAAAITARTKEAISRLGFAPGLAVILVGDDPASHLYVRLKEKASAPVGIRFEKRLFPAGATEKEILDKLAELNGRSDIDAILVQLPLPAPLDENRVIAAIDPAKDVDGFHPQNVAALLRRQERIVPGLAAGILELINSTGATLTGKRAVIVANSQVFCQPLAEILDRQGIRSGCLAGDSPALAERCRQADIVIVAVGQPGLITGDRLKPGAIVIDVGTNRVGNKTVGDVDFASASTVAGHLTPVPGGVGPVTVAMLLANTATLAATRKK